MTVPLHHKTARVQRFLQACVVAKKWGSELARVGDRQLAFSRSPLQRKTEVLIEAKHQMPNTNYQPLTANSNSNRQLLLFILEARQQFVKFFRHAFDCFRRL